MKPKADKIYFWLHGGLGDVIWAYVRGPQWRRFQAIRDLYPDARLKAIVICHNRQSAELLRFNPYIDEVDYRFPNLEQRKRGMSVPQVADLYADGFIPFIKLPEISPFIKKGRPMEALKGEDKLKLESQKIYLSGQREEAIVKRIQDAGPYVFMHPFASVDMRKTLPAGQFNVLADHIIDTMGYNVVVVGDTYTKTFGKGGDKLEETHNIEAFDHERAGLFNLVGKSNVRVALRLLKTADKFLGTWSCFCVTAWTWRIPSITITDHTRAPSANRMHRRKYTGHHPDDVIVSIEPKQTNNQVVRQTAQILEKIS